MSSLNLALEHYKSNKNNYLNKLKDLVRIPSVSFEGFDPQNVVKSAQATAQLMEDVGLQNIKVISFEKAHPYVYGEWLGAKGQPTILLYAHHDVQPPGKVELWHTPPFEPTLKGDRLFGRGAADDKAGVVCHLAAIGSYLKSVGSLPLNVKIIVEGEEEVGSDHLEGFLKKYHDLVQADIMVLTDTSNFDVGIPALTVALRGLVAVNVEVKSLRQSVHSGMWGGPLPDPVLALSKMLAALVDEKGRIAIPGIWEKVRPLSDHQKEMLATLPYDEKLFREQSGLLPKSQFIGDGSSVYSKMWYQPSISVNAIQSGSRKAPANIINEAAWAKVGIRIVPDLDPADVQKKLIQFLKEKTPWGLECEITLENTGGWWSTNPEGPVFEAARRALKLGYGVDPVFMGSGGSIPFVQPFSDALGGVPALLIGVEDPLTNAHSENESLCVSDFEKACLSAIYLYDELKK